MTDDEADELTSGCDLLVARFGQDCEDYYVPRVYHCRVRRLHHNSADVHIVGLEGLVNVPFEDLFVNSAEGISNARVRAMLLAVQANEWRAKHGGS